MILLQGNDQFTGFIGLDYNPLIGWKACIGQPFAREDDGRSGFLATEISNLVDFERTIHHEPSCPRQPDIDCLKAICGYLLHAIG